MKIQFKTHSGDKHTLKLQAQVNKRLSILRTIVANDRTMFLTHVFVTFLAYYGIFTIFFSKGDSGILLIWLQISLRQSLHIFSLLFFS